MPNAEHTLVVISRRVVATDVVEFVLGPPTPPIPEWRPGAHIALGLPSGKTRDYSLIDGAPAGCVRIAVLHERDGRGGSEELHNSVMPGDTLTVMAVRNEMELRPATDHLLIAAGIGITPLLSMARHLTAIGARWQLHYVGRSLPQMSYLDEIRDLANSADGLASVHVVDRSELPRPHWPEIIERCTDDTVVYCCGPADLITEVEALCDQRSLPVVTERFGRSARASSPSAPPVVTGDGTATPIDPDGGFTVEFAQSGSVSEIPSDTSILEVARTLKPGLSFSCSDGYCGTCETAVIAGTPDHRDTVLSEDEQAEGETMMICVSRSRTARIVLDL